MLSNDPTTDFSLSPYAHYLHDPTLQPLPFYTRTPPPQNSTSNTLMSRTLHTLTTIRAIQYLYAPPPTTPSSSKSASAPPLGSLLALISLGPEMCSHENVLHGGINTVLVDEVGGVLAMQEASKGTAMMAVNFNVNLKRSVRIKEQEGQGRGTVVLGRAWFERVPEVRMNFLFLS